MRFEPLLQFLARDDPGRDAFEQRHGLILVFHRMSAPGVAIPFHKLEQAEESRPLVPIRHRVIADQVPREYGSLCGELGIGLDATEAPSRRCESGLGERNEALETDQRLSGNAKNTLRDSEVVG